ncbi:MAG TPA: hypothetical protein VFB43_04770 [Terracidiphilus sp.]|nr:hypothetical protein [Terracidiphilus sp.]
MSLNTLSLWPLRPWPLFVDEGDTVQGGYQLALGGQHPGATVLTDVKCFDGTSHTLTIPMPANQTHSIAAGSHLFVPGFSVYLGSATAPVCGGGATHGVVVGSHFSALGVANGVDNPPLGNGSSDSANGIPSRFADSIAVNFQH